MANCLTSRKCVAAIIGGCPLLASAFTFVPAGSGRESHTIATHPLHYGTAATMDIPGQRVAKQADDEHGATSKMFRAGCAASAFVGVLSLRNRAHGGSRMGGRQRTQRRFNLGRLIFSPSEDWQGGLNGYAAVFMRCVAALLIFHHGMEHTAKGGLPGTNVEAVQAMADFMIKPYFGWVPLFSATQLVIIRDYCECFGALLLLFGLFTRGAALVLSSTMSAAIYYHLNADGFSAFSFEEPALLLVIFVFFLINGAGPISLDAYIKEFLVEEPKGA